MCFICMKCHIRRKVCSINVVTPKNWWLLLRDPQSRSNDCIQISYCCHIGYDFVLILILPRDTVACFQALHAIKLWPKTHHIPLRSSLVKIIRSFIIQKTRKNTSGSRPKVQAIRDCQANTSENVLDNRLVWIMRWLKVLANTINRRGNVWFGDSEVL